jgi:hypothetical protein
MGNEIDTTYPKPPGRPRGRAKGLKAEKKLQGVEAAAIAYIQMENGEYRYPEGARRQYNEDGTPRPNERELLRRAGYGPGSLTHIEYLYDQDEFWQFVELHRLRRTDPMFRRDKQNQLWAEIGNEALRNLYETVFYYPHSLSPEQHIKIVKLVLDAGISMNKIGKGEESKTDKLMESIEDDEKRKKILQGYKKNLEKELEEIEALDKAHDGASVVEVMNEHQG